MGGKTGTVKMVKKVNWLHLILIAAVVVAVFAFGKLTHFFGKYTGEVADDDRMFNKQAAAWDGSGSPVTLSAGDATAYLPVTDTFSFDSEETVQPLDIGNPAENGQPMNFTLRVQDKDIYSSGILEPGKGIEAAETNTYFQPDTYDATMVYTFYYQDGSRLKTLDTVEKPITLHVEGSGERYRAGITKK